MEQFGLGKLTPLQEEIFSSLTQKLIEAIDNGQDIPWHNPVKSGGQQLPPTNFLSQEPYTGINLIILTTARKVNPYWLTFQQIKKLKGKIKKGTHGQRILFYKTEYFDQKTKKRITEQEAKRMISADYFTKKVVKYYFVHNLEDVEGITFQLPDSGQRTDAEAVEAAEQVIRAMPDPPAINIRDESFSPHYIPDLDEVHMPGLKMMDSDQEYYSVFFHELIHSTSHQRRTNRVQFYKKRDQKQYAFEELIAELGAVFLCAETGILFHTYNNSLAYLKHWKRILVQQMQEDIQFVAKAAIAAQQAVDYMLTGDKPDYGRSDDQPEPDPNQDPQPVPGSRDVKALVRNHPTWKGRYCYIDETEGRTAFYLVWANERIKLERSTFELVVQKDWPTPYFQIAQQVFIKGSDDPVSLPVTDVALHENPNETLYYLITTQKMWFKRKELETKEDIAILAKLKRRQREREQKKFKMTA
jgi:antirestriction protein ArdC